MQVAIAAGTFVRIIDNSTNDYGAAFSIAHACIIRCGQ
eukprot:SAG11_NODE_254_length_11587_cov_4.312913_12_plen_38_part_00